MPTYSTAKMSVLTYRDLNFCLLSVIMRQYVTWLERKFDACQTPRSIYPCIFNSFRVIRCLSQCISPKIAVFTYRSLHFFCFPWRRPCVYHAVCCMDEKGINAYKLCGCMYLSNYNSFRVIQCWSQCVSPKIAIFTTFLFPLGTPLGQSCNMLHGWKANSMLVKPLAAYTQLSSTVSQLFQPQVQKIVVFKYHSSHFCFPWRRPCDYDAIFPMDVKTIGCLSNPSPHVPIYLQ